jgi:hypothetical protein
LIPGRGERSRPSVTDPNYQRRAGFSGLLEADHMSAVVASPRPTSFDPTNPSDVAVAR